MVLDHKTPKGRTFNAIIVQTWIRKGTQKTGAQIQQFLKDEHEAVAEYSMNSLTSRLACDWRKRIRKQLSIRKISHEGADVGFEVGKWVYDRMFLFKNAGRKKTFPQYFVDEVRNEFRQKREEGVVIGLCTFIELCKDVANAFDSHLSIMEKAEGWETLRSRVNRTSKTSFWELLQKGVGGCSRTVSNSEPLPLKYEAMSEVFVSKVLKLIAKHRTPPQLLLNLDETSVQFVFVGKTTYEFPEVKQVKLIGSNDKRAITYTPVVSCDGAIVISQVILPGKSAGDEQPEDMWQNADHLRYHKLLFSHSGGKKTWQNSLTFRQLIQAIDSYVSHRLDFWGDDASAAILLLDCAGCHTSRAAIEVLGEFPRIVPVFVPPKTTSLMQPLDRSFFGPFKALLKTAVARFMLTCGYKLGSMSKEQKRTYLRQVMEKKNILKHLAYEWLPSCLRSLSPKTVKSGWMQVCKEVFPEQLTSGFQTNVNLESSFWSAKMETASNWPNFHETAKLKTVLYGDSFEHYSMTYLKGLCRQRNLKVGGSKPDLIERLEKWEEVVDEHPDFQEPAEEQSGGETDVIEDDVEKLITYENEASASTDVDGESDLQVEDEAPVLTDQLFDIERFVRFDEEKNAMEVKWSGYSSRYNTLEPCSKLEIDLGKPLFRAMSRQILDLFENRPRKRSRTQT